jgi:regulator of replication initiation timing
MAIFSFIGTASRRLVQDLKHDLKHNKAEMLMVGILCLIGVVQTARVDRLQGKLTTTQAQLTTTQAQLNSTLVESQQVYVELEKLRGENRRLNAARAAKMFELSRTRVERDSATAEADRIKQQHASTLQRLAD